MTTYIDLFSGIGGCRMAAEAEKFRPVLSVEWDAACADVQAENFGERPLVSDIRRLPDSEIPPADFVVATPPCQPFSVLGKRLGFADPRSWVWWDVLRVLRVSRATTLVLESVPGLATVDGGRILGAMVEYLRVAGYRATWAVIPATRVGAAQHRPRLFIVAGRLDRPPFDFDRLPERPAGRIADLLTPGPHPWLDPAEYTLLDPPRPRRSGLIFSGYLHRPVRSETGDMGTAGTHRQMSQIYDASGVHPTLLSVGRGGWYPVVRVGDGARRLVATEVLRLQGFPDGFRFPRRGLLGEQVGNSVYVPLIRLLLREIRAQLL